MANRFPISSIYPPYTNISHSTDGDNEQDGTVLALRISGRAHEPDLLDSTRDVVRRNPRKSVVVLLDADAAFDVPFVLALGAATVDLGIPVMRIERWRQDIREALTRNVVVTRSFATWLKITGVCPDERLATLLTTMLNENIQLHSAAEPLSQSSVRWTLNRMAGALGVADRTLREQHKRARLPAPKCCARLARRLADVSFLQRNFEISLGQAAIMLGYADQPSLSRNLHDSFGITAVEARNRLGCSWLAARWLRRCGEFRSAGLQ